MNPLQTIAQALPLLHDDAYNPVRAASVEPIEVNVWTIEALADNERATTHPHLRRAQGARSIPVPSGDRDAAHLYRTAVTDITAAYRSHVPDARPRGYAGPPPPADLISMLAAIQRAGLELDTKTGRSLVALADKLKGWTHTETPKAGYPTCANPLKRRQCTGHPVIANDLCRKCYDHARWLERRPQQQEAS